MKWKPIVGWAAAIIIVLILMSFAALKIFVSPETVAMLVIPRVEQVFGRDVTFSNVDLSYFPHLGVRLQGVEIKNTAAFPEQPLARINHIDANIEFFSILSGDPQIERLVVDGWEMLLQVDSLGHRNFLVPGADSITTADTLRLIPGNIEPLCREFRLTGGRLLYRNDSTNVRLVLAGIDASYSLKGERSEQFHGSFTVDSLLTRNKLLDLRVIEDAAEGEFDGIYLVKADSLAIDKCSWRVDAFHGRLNGQVTGLRSQPAYSLHLLSERTVLEDAINSQILALVPSFAQLDARGNLRLEVTYSDTTADTLPPQVRGEVNLTDFSLTIPGSKIGAKVRFAEANFNDHSLSLYTEGAAIGEAPALVRFTVGDFSDPTYSGEINFSGEAAEVLGIFGIEEPVGVGGNIEASLSGFIHPTEIEAGRLFGSLLVDNLSYRDSVSGVGIDGLNLESRFVGSSVEIQKFNLAIGADTLNIDGDIADFPLAFAHGIETLRRPKLDLHIASKGFDFDTLTALNSVAALGSSDTSNVWRLVNQLLDFNAACDLAIDSGRFWGVDFTNLSGGLSVVDRIVYSDSAHVHAFGGDLEGDAVLDFSSLFEPDLEIDLRGRNLEAAQYLGYYAGLGDAVSGPMNLNCSITGRGVGGDSLRQTLGIKGNFTIDQGFVLGLPIADAFRNDLGIQPFYRSRFSGLVCDFILANQTVRFNQLAFDSGPVQYSVTGNINFDGEVAVDIDRTLLPDEIEILSRLPDARSLMPRNPHSGIFRINGTDAGYQIGIDSFR